MTEKTSPKTPVQYVAEIESVRLTNATIRVSWKAMVMVSVLVARSAAGIALAATRKVRRDREEW
jgi:hypothetical protein